MGEREEHGGGGRDDMRRELQKVGRGGKLSTYTILLMFKMKFILVMHTSKQELHPIKKVSVKKKK